MYSAFLAFHAVQNLTHASYVVSNSNKRKIRLSRWETDPFRNFFDSKVFYYCEMIFWTSLRVMGIRNGNCGRTNSLFITKVATNSFLAEQTEIFMLTIQEFLKLYPFLYKHFSLNSHFPIFLKCLISAVIFVNLWKYSKII